MEEKLKQETVEELVKTAHTQAAYLIETMLRQAVADFEASGSEDFKLAISIEGQRKIGGGVLTIQANGQSSINLKRKDQTPAITIDYGPTLFDANGNADVSSSDSSGPKLLAAPVKMIGDGVIEGSVEEENNQTEGE